MKRTLLAGVGLVIGLSTSAIAWSEEESRAADQRLEELRSRAAALEVRVGKQGEGDEVQVSKEPLMRFDDPTRDFYDGALWCWGKSGRPPLLVAVEKYEKFWSYELISLGGQPFTLKSPDGFLWKPEEPPFVEQVIEGIEPGDTPTARRQQARQISRRFEMAEYLPGETAQTVLRLVPRPIHEYDDAKASITSGSLFVFANGTNPEILLLVEAFEPEGGAAVWRFGCAALSTARLEAKLAGRPVWEAAAVSLPKKQRPYAIFTLPVDDAESER